MNLRVDLILATEQRNASAFNLKSALRITILVVPSVIIIVVALLVMDMIRCGVELDGLQAQWKKAEPRKEAAAKLRKDLAAHMALEKDVSGWRVSRLNWHEQLRTIQKEVPPEFRIQFRKLSINSSLSLVDGKDPGRSDVLTVQGIAFGENAESNVENLKQALMASPGLTGRVDKVEIARFAASDAGGGASKLDRIFQIDVTYKPRKFE